MTGYGVASETLLDGFTGLALSTGSACESTKTETSHVLRAMRRTAAEIGSTFRFGLGRGTKTQDIDRATHIIKKYFEARSLACGCPDPPGWREQ